MIAIRSNAASVEFRGVTKIYGKSRVPAVDDISLFIEAGLRLRQGSGVAAGDDHARALGGERLGGGQADAAGAAGDEYGLAFETVHEVLQ